MGAEQTPARAPTILIVEQDDSTATDLQAALHHAGWRVRRVGSARDALAALDSSRVDLIVTGLFLPDCDGLILCSAARARSGVPIVVLTEPAREVDRALALAAGATTCQPPSSNDGGALVTHLSVLLRAPVPAGARSA